MKNILKIVLAVAALVCAGSAYAVGMLTVFDGTTTVTITDGSALDSNPAPGVVTWIGSIGVWNLNVDTGLTKPAVGSATSPQMDLSFLANSTRAGTLTVTWSDSGFSVAPGTQFVDQIGGTTAGTVVDNILKNGNVKITQGPFGPGAFSGTVSGTGTHGLVPSDVVSLQVVINHSRAGLSTGDKNAFVVQVPDGGSAVALFGIAFVGLEALRRKLKAA